MKAVDIKYENLILGYLRGDLDSQERVELERWLSTSKDNRDYFSSISRVWEATGYVHQGREYDVEAALAKVNKKIDAIEADKARRDNRPWLVRNLRYVASIAAVIALGVFTYFAVSQREQEPPIVLACGIDTPEQQFILPDGSSVTMKALSNLQYPQDFDAEIRSVDFHGSAYFDIAANPDKPFRICCDNMIVEVLGTSFDLVAIQDADTYFLDLYSGAVKLCSVDDNNVVYEQVVLKPGERGVYYLNTNTIEKISESELMLRKELNDNTLEFNNTKLSLVVASLEVSYDVKIDLDSSLEDKRLTARFDGESLDVVLETISDIFDIQVVRSGKNIIIR